MSSNNVIQFPGSGQPGPQRETSKEKTTKRIPLHNKHVVGFLIITFSLFTFNYKFFSDSEGGFAERSSLSSGRKLASIQGGMERYNAKAELAFAKSLASIDLKASVSPEAIGRAPSSDDQIRHGVLASRGYIFKRSLEDGNLVSIELQSDEHNPAYLLDPQDFLTEYGHWVNKDFSSLESIDQEDQIVNDKRISHFLLTTKSGRRFKITVERDLFQRLTTISQTEVDQNSFN